MRGRRRAWKPDTWAERTSSPRVLVEDPDGAVLAAAELFLRRDGFEFAGCAGPHGEGRRGCPLAAGGECALAAGADVVYSNLSWDEPANRTVLTALRERYPHTPVVVEASALDAERLHEQLADCGVVRTPSGRTRMLAAVRSALAS
jgi:hypothetical protein